MLASLDRPLGRLLGAVRFDRNLEAEYRADFDRIGRGSRSELWIILVGIVATSLVFNRVVLDVPPEVMPLGRFLLAGVVVPMVLRWLSSDRSPLHKWSSGLYIASVYIDVVAMMVLRVACIDHGIDAVPVILPVAVLMSLVVVQIRFLVLVPAILVGLALIVIIELAAFVPDTNRLFQLVAATAMVIVSLTAAYGLERWTRIGWLRQRELDALARTDALTGLPNRRHFEEWLRAAARSGDRISLMILDIDHFKAYNDRFGHLAGDRCLAAVGECLKEAAGPDALVARLGGEEFAAVWRDGAARDAERLRCSLTTIALQPIPGVRADITASAGFADIRSDGLDVDEAVHELLARADTALYEAKFAGRDQLMSYAGQPLRGSRGRRRAAAEDSESAPVLSGGMRFADDAVEADFRAEFDREGRGGRRLIMAGLLGVVAWLLAFQAPLLKIPAEADLLGRLTLVVGLVPAALVALVGNSWSRLTRWAPQLYIGAVVVILAAQMFERVLQLRLGYDVVPWIMPISVLLSLMVVQIRFAMLLPAALLALTGVVAVELGALPITGNRLLSVAAGIVMVIATLRFAYKFERTRRASWLTERRLDEFARRDVLTGLLNQRQFGPSVRDLLGRAAVRDRPVVFMILDIDHFKSYNDTRGHLAGDDCLRDVGARLGRLTNGLDGIAARLGGEEFAVVWVDDDGNGAIRAEQVRQGVSDSGVTASAGIVVAPPLGDVDARGADLHRRADAALYVAKHSGRDRSELAESPSDPTRMR